jgi:hypothetical protein
VSDDLTYVYCLIRAGRRPSTRKLPEGMPGSRDPRVLDAGGRLWAIAATVPGDDYGEAALARGLQDLEWVGRRAVAHESVVEHFLGAAAVLPMQLFTLFTSDARARDHVARDRRRIDRILERIEGHVEWGLRLSFDADAPLPSDAAGRVRSRPNEPASGAAYLARKRDVLGASRLRLETARADADRVFQTLAKEAAEARRRSETERALPGSRVLLDAAFLVPARRTGAFRTAVRRAARTLNDSAVVVSLTGPWPPYNFIDSAPPRRRRGQARLRSGAARTRRTV